MMPYTPSDPREAYIAVLQVMPELSRTFTAVVVRSGKYAGVMDFSNVLMLQARQACNESVTKLPTCRCHPKYTP